jgi:DUF971 family protein
MTPQTTPVQVNLKRDEKLEIQWQDGVRSVYPIEHLRTMCPCAACRTVRQENKPGRSLLTVLPGNFANRISVVSAELVGNYALKIHWSDEHETGIYSFEYLRSISPGGRG